METNKMTVSPKIGGLTAVFIATAMLGSLWVVTLPASAADEDCSRALVVSTTTSSSRVISQLSMAWHVSEEAWKTAKTEGGVDAVIQGVPVLGSYREFREEIRKRAESYRLESFDERSYAYATSGLDKYALEAYKICINRKSEGLFVFAGERSAGTIEIYIYNLPGIDVRQDIKGELPVKINLSRSSAEYLAKELAHSYIHQKWDKRLTLVPSEVTKEIVVNIKFGNVAKTLVLPPFNLPPKACQFVLRAGSN
jgi:hypothetical protein